MPPNGEQMDIVAANDHQENLTLLDELKKNACSGEMERVEKACTNLVKRLAQLDDQSEDTVRILHILYQVADSGEVASQCIIFSGAYPDLVGYLKSDNVNVVREAMSLLARLAFRSKDASDLLIDQKGVPILIDLFRRDLPREVLKPIACCLSCLFRDSSVSKLDDKTVRDCLPIMKELLMFDEDFVVSEACRAIGHIVDRWGGAHLEQILNLNIRQRLEQIEGTSSDLFNVARRTLTDLGY